MNTRLISAITTVPLAAAGIIAFSSSAQAISLNGSITINGSSTITKNTTNNTATIDYGDVDDLDVTGDFAAFLSPLDPGGKDKTLPILTNNGGYLNITDLTLTKVSGNNYKLTNSVTSFLDFGTRTLGSQTGTLTFDLDPITAPNYAYVGTSSFSVDVTGIWKFNGQTIATGGLSASTVNGLSSYTISLESQSVPESNAFLGLGIVGLGLVAMTGRNKKINIK